MAALGTGTSSQPAFTPQAPQQTAATYGNAAPHNPSGIGIGMAAAAKLNALRSGNSAR